LKLHSGAIAQVLDQIKAVQDWVANRPDYFVLGGTFNTSPESASAVHAAVLSQLGDANFGDLATPLPASARLTRRKPQGTADYIFTRPALLGQQLRIIPANLTAHEPVICELELDPAKQIVARPVPPMAQDATGTAGPNSTASLAVMSPPPQPTTGWGSLNPWWIASGLGLLLLLCIFLLIIRGREPRQPTALIADRQAASSSPSYVIVTPSSMTATHAGSVNEPKELRPVVHIDSSEPGAIHSETWPQHSRFAEEQSTLDRETLRAQLANWLKQKFVRKIVADRAAMIQAQNAAALQALEVDQRLARIEKQIEDQNAAYEQRITELTAELNAARYENREMIRARIAQVKSEMLKARERLMAEAQQPGHKQQL